MNILGIALATLAAFVIGFAWFNGKTFYPIWYKALNKEIPNMRPEEFTPEMKKEANIMFGTTFVSQVGQAIVMAWLIDTYHLAYGSMNAGTGAIVGLLAGFGIAALSSLPHRLFAQQGFKVWIIEVGGDIVALVAMGAILGAF